MSETTVTAPTARPRVDAPRRGRADGAVKASGRARYTADLELPGMLHARLLLAGRPHARLRSLSVERARVAPGVRAVLTQADVPDVRYGMCVRDRTLFVDEVARYEGEIVAAVAADTREQASAAVGLIAAEWEELPPLLDPEAALAFDAVPLHPSWRAYAIDREETRSANDCAHVTLVKGDVEAGFASAFAVVEQSFATDMTHPLAIEPHAVLADWRDGAVTIWTTTQVPFLARAGVALTLGLPESAVRVVVTHLGGGFGGKCDFHLEAHAAALSRAAGRPVRLVLSRAEEFVVPDLTRHPISMTFATALRADGTIAARRARLVLDSGAYASHGPTASEIATLMAVGPYRIDDLAIEAHTVYTSRTPAGSTRAPTGPQLCWALEQHTDALAARAGLDPIAFRLRNLVGDGDSGPTGQRLVRPTARDCLLRADEVMRASGSGSDAARADAGGGDAARADAPLPVDAAGADWLEGVGFAVGTWGNVPLPSGASVRMHADGSATLVSGAQDNGSGAAVALPALVADALGIAVERVALVHQDTGATPFDYGSLGSQTTFNAGRAALSAASEVAARLRGDAAERLGCAAKEVVLRGGFAWHTPDRADSVREGGADAARDPDADPLAEADAARVPIADLAAAAQAAGRPLAAEASPQPPERPAEPGAGRSRGRAMYSSFPFPVYYCCAARVAVDPATGRVIVRRVVACHDVGEVLNRPGAEGQVEGGVAHSLGLALSEGAVLDGGRQLTTRLMDYRLQTAADMPPIDVELIAPRT
ncbi:MAG TPA: xanthine dehydrogenase family protein molybdopterin-binding subunit, partial [Conexibacter sp.]|nr:xanthine dehydrogenase family protein molybdopterin-binding subunit [Conexibacter sp.]